MHRHRTREVAPLIARVTEGHYSMQLLGERLEYELRRSSRSTLGITVTAQAKVQVTAPHAAERDRVELILRRRGEWIRRNLRETAALPPVAPPKEWVSGETHLYLGRQYRLSIRASYQDGVRLVGRYFQVGREAAPEPRLVDQLMAEWYLTHARSTFERRLAHLVATTPRLELDAPPPLIVRTMRNRWGSCTPAGRILMNVAAVKLPVSCIDYVLMHELCHLRHSNHNRRFWHHLDCCMPGWERLRRRLDRTDGGQ